MCHSTQGSDKLEEGLPSTRGAESVAVAQWIARKFTEVLSAKTGEQAAVRWGADKAR